MGISQANLFYGPDKEARKKRIEKFIHERQPRFIHIFGDERAVGIDEVREIIRRAMVSVGEGIQLFIIERSDQMSREAQNAFLKILEEPPRSSVFILSAESEKPLLATVRSRLAKFPFFGGRDTQDTRRVSALQVKDRDEAEQYFNSEITELKKELEARIRKNEDWKLYARRLEKCIRLEGLLTTSRVSPRYLIDSYTFLL